MKEQQQVKEKQQHNVYINEQDQQCKGRVLILLQRLLYWRICCDVKLLIDMNCSVAKERLQGKGKDVANNFVMH